MEIASTNTTQITGGAATAATVSEAETTEAGTLITSDFETFLKMLTTQMENQDPLNPIESTDFAVQLATFSGVEQQVRTNDLLAAMQSQLGAMGMSDLAGWVGMEVRGVMPAYFSASPITLQPDPPSEAEQAWVVVRDSNQTLIDRIEIAISDEPIQWAGVDARGDPLPAGNYSFHLQSYAEGAMVAEEQIAVYAEVEEARVEDGQTVLVLEGGGEISASEVDGLRRPEG